MNELADFIKISKYSGERFDLIQAGGGNSSVKNDDGTMYIKASGVCLSDVDDNFGYAIIQNRELLKIFNNEEIYHAEKRMNDKIMADYIAKVNLTPNFKPSIETLLHSMLCKYTLHTHPVLVNAITNRKEWKEILIKIFGQNIMLIDYKTPGISLALELREKIKNKKANIIFLQNHGLIVTSDVVDDIKKLTEYVLDKIEKFLNVDMSKYNLTNEVSEYINANSSTHYIAYLSDDSYLNDNLSSPYIFSKPFCPDKMVYCGVSSLLLQDNISEKIEDYKKRYHDIPKIVLYKGYLFFIAKNIKKAKEIEEVFKFHLMALIYSQTKEINFLPQEEIQYIGNWEAEKYRQNI